MSEASEARIQAAFVAYLEAVESWVRRKPDATVDRFIRQLQEKAAVGNTFAALELAILEAALGADATAAKPKARAR